MSSLILLSVTVAGSEPVHGRPERCVEDFRIEGSYRSDLIIIPGVTNCFSCALDSASNDTILFWYVSVDHQLLPASSVPHIETEGNFLILPTPESYVEPGTAGRKDIVCTDSNGQELEARLVSPGKKIKEIQLYHYTRYCKVSKFLPISINAHLYRFVAATVP